MSLVRFVVSGMCALTPPSSAKKEQEITFLLMDAPTPRMSSHFPQDETKQIVAHTGFVAVSREALLGNGRAPDIPNNTHNLAAWRLSKERLTLANDPNQGLSFDL